VRSSENIEKLVKNLELDVDTHAQVDQAVLSELLDAQKKSMKQDSAFVGPNIRRFIMKSPMTKLAVTAVIIIAVVIGIDPFSSSKTNVLWADVLERFESVPFFRLTIYLGYENSEEAKKIEIWKSENSHVRAHEGNKVIFADFSNKETNIVAFDRATKQPINNMGYVSMILKELCSEGRFSLDTIINIIPSEDGITSVETADTAASKETVVFEIKHKETPEWISIWALRSSKLPVRMCFHDPRNNEHGDFFFDYSEQKDAKFFDPDTFKNEVRKQSSPTKAFDMQEVVDVFRRWTVLSGGVFPSSLGIEAIKDIDPNVDASFIQTGNLHFETPKATLDRDNPLSQEETNKYLNSVMYVLFGKVQEAMAEVSDWHYAGKGVKIGDAETPIFWCRPQGSKTYRTIYGDLSVKDVKPGNLPM
jgi:hypothetical protein